MTFAIAIMGMTFDTFRRLSPSEYMKAKGRFTEEQNTKFKQSWELARWTAFRTACPPQPEKGSKTVSLYDFARFPWEKGPEKTEIPPSTRERFEELQKRWN